MSVNTNPRTWLSGEVVTAAMLNTELRNFAQGLQAPWDAWVPTRVNFTVGTGSEVARFFRMGKTVMFRYRLTLGSTSTVSGNINLSLPVAPAANYVVNDVIQGAAHFYDASAGAGSRTAGTPVYDGAGGIILLADRLAAATVNATNPWTWASGDIFSVAGTYESQ